LRLVRVSTYLSQFQLEVKYRLEKQHIISDALSRLFAASAIGADVNVPEALDIDIYYSEIENSEVSDQIYVYQDTLIAISADFKQRLLDGYSKKKFWRNLKNMLTDLEKRISQKQAFSKQVSYDSNQILDNHNNIDKKSVLKKFRIEIDFEFRNNLIYYSDKDNIRLRLYISRSTEKDIFKTIYDDNYYSDYHRCFARICETLFISRALSKIRIYIEYCSVCQINQTKRHRSYSKLMSISTEPHPFHIIAIDYVVELSGKYDCLLTIIDKFSRRLQLIAGYITNSAIV